MLPQISAFGVHIPTFFVVISISLSVLLFWLSSRLDSEKGRSFHRVTAFNLSLLIMISGFLGGRFFHVFYEEWSYYQQYPTQIFKFWNGGFVYFGGMISAAVAAYIYLKREKQNFLLWADFMTPLLSASYALGRIGCLFEGCCYGKYCELPWAISGRHPTQIYMILGEIFVLALLLLLERRQQADPVSGYLFIKWILLHSIFRFVFEFFRDDDRGSLIAGLSISQVVSLFLILLSGYFLLRQLKKIKM
jgi:phosphatidylglycerol:prolipoprotein diacylglycerol transferase